MNHKKPAFVIKHRVGGLQRVVFRYLLFKLQIIIPGKLSRRFKIHCDHIRLESGIYIIYESFAFLRVGAPQYLVYFALPVME